LSIQCFSRSAIFGLLRFATFTRRRLDPW